MPVQAPGAVGAYRRAAGGVRLVMVASMLTPADPTQLGYQPVLGTHVYVGRDVYSHHGIDCGDWTVIDFGGTA
jgi:hypothetical protein